MLLAATLWGLAPGLALAASGGLTNPDDCIKISIPVFKTGTQSCQGGTGINNSGNGGAIIPYLKSWLIFFNDLVGIVIILMLTVAGIQYIASTGDPNNIKSAKNRVVNAVIALVLYLMMFAILQFLVPGGIL